LTWRCLDMRSRAGSTAILHNQALKVVARLPAEHVRASSCAPGHRQALDSKSRSTRCCGFFLH